MTFRSVFTVIFIISVFTLRAFASTIVLESGKSIEGTIVEQSDELLKVDTGSGVPISYYLDEITSVDGQKVAPKPSAGDAGTPREIIPKEEVIAEDLPAQDVPSENEAAKLKVSFGSPMMAIGYYEAALKDNPDDAVANHQIGTAYNQLQRYAEAIPYLEKAVALAPRQEESFHNLGYAHMMLENYDQAEANYRKALEIKPDYADALANMGYVKLAAQEYQEAADYLQRAVTIDPDSGAAYENLAFAYVNLGQFEKVQGYLMKSRDLYTLKGERENAQRIDAILDELTGAGGGF